MQVIIPLAGKGTRSPAPYPSGAQADAQGGGAAGDGLGDGPARRARRERADLHHRPPQGAGRGLRPEPLRDSLSGSSSRRSRTAPPAPSTWRGPFVHEPVLIIFVDTVFEADLTLINRTDADGIIWAKEVEDYQRFGVVVTDAQGYMTRIVEKPTSRSAEARQHRALLHPRGGQPVAGHRPGAGAPQEQGRIFPHRRLPVDDRARQADPDRGSRWLVRLRQARTHYWRPTRPC